MTGHRVAADLEKVVNCPQAENLELYNVLKTACLEEVKLIKPQLARESRYLRRNIGQEGEVHTK